MTRLIDISEDSRHPYQGILASSSEKFDHDHCMEQRRRLETQLEEALTINNRLFDKVKRLEQTIRDLIV